MIFLGLNCGTTLLCSDIVGDYWTDSPVTMLPIYEELIAAGLRIWVFRFNHNNNNAFFFLDHSSFLVYLFLHDEICFVTVGMLIQWFQSLQLDVLLMLFNFPPLLIGILGMTTKRYFLHFSFHFSPKIKNFFF